MAREHNLIQQQDRRRNLQPARYLPCRYTQPASDLPNNKPATCQQKPATCQQQTSDLPNRTLQPSQQKPATCQQNPATCQQNH